MLKRIKNLLLWSEISPISVLTDKQKLDNGFPILISDKPKKLAQIISRRDPVKEALKTNE